MCSIGWHKSRVAGRNDVVNDHPEVPACYLAGAAALQTTTTKVLCQRTGLVPTRGGLTLEQMFYVFPDYKIRIRVFQAKDYQNDANPTRAARAAAESLIRNKVDPGFCCLAGWTRHPSAGLHHIVVVGVSGNISWDVWGEGQKIGPRRLQYLEYAAMNSLDGGEGRWTHEGFPDDPESSGDWCVVYPDQPMLALPSPTRRAVHELGMLQPDPRAIVAPSTPPPQRPPLTPTAQSAQSSGKRRTTPRKGLTPKAQSEISGHSHEALREAQRKSVDRQRHEARTQKRQEEALKAAGEKHGSKDANEALGELRAMCSMREVVPKLEHRCELEFLLARAGGGAYYC